MTSTVLGIRIVSMEGHVALVETTRGEESKRRSFEISLQNKQEIDGSISLSGLLRGEDGTPRRCQVRAIEFPNGMKAGHLYLR